MCSTYSSAQLSVMVWNEKNLICEKYLLRYKNEDCLNALLLLPIDFDKIINMNASHSTHKMLS